MAPTTVYPHIHPQNFLLAHANPCSQLSTGQLQSTLFSLIPLIQYRGFHWKNRRQEKKCKGQRMRRGVWWTWHVLASAVLTCTGWSLTGPSVGCHGHGGIHKLLSLKELLVVNVCLEKRSPFLPWCRHWRVVHAPANNFTPMLAQAIITVFSGSQREKPWKKEKESWGKRRFGRRGIGWECNRK